MKGEKPKVKLIYARSRSLLSLPFFLSFFCDYSPSSNFFQHEERSCLFRDTSLLPKVSLSRDASSFLFFLFSFFFFP